MFIKDLKANNKYLHNILEDAHSLWGFDTAFIYFLSVLYSQVKNVLYIVDGICQDSLIKFHIIWFVGWCPASLSQAVK